MRAALALWAVVAALAPSVEAALVRGGEQRTGLLRQSKVPELKVPELKVPDSASVDATSKAQAQVTKFGPGNCFSTWRNEDGHCEVETHCKDHDISKYTVKFICIDTGGEKVRHVFAPGSFDSEEQFDTLIECRTCLAEKQEMVEVVDEHVPLASPHGKQAKSEKKEEEESDEPGGAPLSMLKEEVKELEGFMMNTSAELQKLNAKVYSKDFKPKGNPPCVDCDSVGKKAAAKAVKLVAHDTVHHEQRSDVVVPQIVEPVRLEAQALRVKKEHRRHLAEDDDEEDEKKSLVDATKKAEAVASSLAGALRTAEVRDDSAPASQPTKSPMVLPKAAKQKQRSRVVPMASDDDGDGDDGDSGDDGVDSDIPESADEYEHQEEDDGRPSFSALQQHKDDEDSDEDDGRDDADAVDAEGSA